MMKTALRGDAVSQHSETDLVEFRQGGMRWVAEKAIAAELRERIVPHLGALESAGAVPMKHTVTRSVYRLALGSGRGVFIKVHRVRSLRERLKYLVLVSRASNEWNVSRALAARGVAAARAVAMGERRVAGILTVAVVVTAEIPGAAPLDKLIEQELGAVANGEAFRRKRELLRKVAIQVSGLHAAGVLHGDLHGGNILRSGGELFLIDLHRARVRGTLSSRRRVANVAQFLAHLRGLVTWGDRMRFVAAYLGQPSRETVHRFVREMAPIMARISERRHASRTKRCVMNSTRFRHERITGMNVYRRADFAPDLVRRAVEGHRAAAGGDVLKRDHRGSVTVVDLRGGRRVCVKGFVRPGLIQRIGDLFRGSRARAAWVGANACAVRAISTPRALAVAELGPHSFFITEYVEGAARLNDYVADHARPLGAEAARKWRRFVRQAADFVRRLHSHELRHRDLSAKNILVRERGDGWDFWLVDVGDIRLGGKPTLAQKIRNLGQLGQIYVMPSRTDRLRFYRRYSAGRPEFRRREFLAEISAASRARHENWLAHGGAAILDERRRQGKPV